jgi:hypothetical protein
MDVGEIVADVPHPELGCPQLLLSWQQQLRAENTGFVAAGWHDGARV